MILLCLIHYVLTSAFSARCLLSCIFKFVTWLIDIPDMAFDCCRQTLLFSQNKVTSPNMQGWYSNSLLNFLSIYIPPFSLFLAFDVTITHWCTYCIKIATKSSIAIKNSNFVYFSLFFFQTNIIFDRGWERSTSIRIQVYRPWYKLRVSGLFWLENQPPLKLWTYFVVSKTPKVNYGS